MVFCKRLKELREERGFTQKMMAEQLEVATVTYIKYERGENEPRYNVLLTLSELFNVSIDYLLGKDNEPDIQLYRFKRSIANIGRAAEIFSKDFPDYKEGLYDILLNYLESVSTIDMVDYVDLLYIKEKFVTGLDLLYNEANEIYEDKHVLGMDVSSRMSNLMTNVFEFKQKVDQMIGIVLSEGFLIYSSAPPQKDPYFKDSFLRI